MLTQSHVTQYNTLTIAPHSIAAHASFDITDTFKFNYADVNLILTSASMDAKLVAPDYPIDVYADHVTMVRSAKLFR
jgi:hypothetical protein